MYLILIFRIRGADVNSLSVYVSIRPEDYVNTYFRIMHWAPKTTASLSLVMIASMIPRALSFANSASASPGA